MKNLVLISQVFYPNTQSTSLLFTDLTLNLKSPETKVTVICGFPNGVNNQLVKRYENFQGIDVYRCGINVDLKKGLWQRLVSYFSYLIHAGWKLLTLPQKDIVVGVSNPPFLSIVLMIVSVLTRRGYYFIMHDVYPEGLVAIGKLAASSFATKIWHQLNRISYQYAHKIVVLGRDMQEFLIQQYALEPEKIAYIPNWSLVTTALPTPFEKNDLAWELGLQDKFVVQYSGNMGLWHDIDIFVRAAAALQNHPDIRFLFIGNGIKQQQAQQLARDLALDNTIWMDFVPQEQLSTSLTCAHVALISLRTGLEGIAVPCKIYGIMGSGRAILAQVPARSEVAYAVTEEECGFVIPPGDLDSLVNKIKLLANDRILTNRMGSNSFQAYKSKYMIDVVCQQFKAALNIEGVISS